MKTIIVEDEALAAERLRNLILQFEPKAIIEGSFDTVQDTVEFLQTKRPVDIIFLDIQLADGKSFEIFDRVAVETPIIFTTAYDQFALQAFKYHSIDYLLKPIDPEEIRKALEKFRKISQPRIFTTEELSALKNILGNSDRTYRERFIIKAGNKLQFKTSQDVAFFYADGKTVYLVTKKEARKYIVDHTLEELEQALNPRQFFRVSRKHIVSVDVISEMKGLVSGRVEVKLNQVCDQEISVSRERVQDFKRWLNQ